jgi:hypothetical protein
MLWRAHLTGPALELLRRRIVLSVLLCWVPLAVLSLARAHFLGRAKLSFFRDISANTSFDMKCVNRSLTIGLKAATRTSATMRLREDGYSNFRLDHPPFIFWCWGV